MVTEENFEARAARLSHLLSQTLLAQETERREIAHTLQEGIGQTLAAMALNLRVLESQCVSVQCADLIGDTRSLVSNVLHDIEDLQKQLYPPALESQGVVSAFEIYIQEFARSAHLRVELDAEVWPNRLPDEVESTLFRILQDILEYLRKKPFTTTISVILRFIDGFVHMIVEDNSVEDPEDWYSSLMVERAEGLGGQCILSSPCGRGTRIEVILPFDDRGLA